jgi:molecular chaperone DnaK (HSP70)
MRPDKDGVEVFRVGRRALNGAASWSKDTIFSVKRLMGMDFANPNVQAVLKHVPFTITTPEGGQDARAHVRMGGRLHTPAEISGHILEKLRIDAGTTLGEPVTDAVITVPAYFSDSQRAATREAAEKAGLRVRRIIDEPRQPSASGKRHRVLVFDLGGGTFDISVLHTTTDREGAGQFQILTYVGDPWLGGDDFDHVIIDRIVDWVRNESGTDPRHDPRFMTLAKEKAEQAKRELSQSPSAEVLIPGAISVAPVDVDLSIAERTSLRSIHNPKAWPGPSTMAEPAAGGHHRCPPRRRGDAHP